MPAIPKNTPYRNKKMRQLASECTECMGCGAICEPGSIVGAHSNRQQDGKGMGTKAHDLLAYLCPTCHRYVDGDGDKEVRHNFFLQAVYNTVLWLLKNGHLKT